MNINDKIAARRKEVEQVRQQAAAEEIARRQAEHEAQQEAIRQANAEVVSAGKKKKAIEMPAYMVSLAVAIPPETSVAPQASASVENSIINESLERVTKSELFIFLMLMVLSVFNILRGELGRTLFFGLFALIYIAYILKKHRDEVVAQAKEVAVEVDKEA